MVDGSACISGFERSCEVGTSIALFGLRAETGALKEVLCVLPALQDYQNPSYIRSVLGRPGLS